MNDKIAYRRKLKKIGRMCYDARIKIGYRQSLVGLKIGTTQQVISNFERGHSTNEYIFIWYWKHILSDFDKKTILAMVDE